MKPIIGVTTAISVETWGDPEDKAIYNYVEKDYIRAVYESGGIPFMLAPFTEANNSDDYKDLIENITDKISGLILSGGGNARRFSPNNIPSLLEQQPKRYSFEKMLILEAWNRNLPVIGICRGHQMIAEVLGGSIMEETVKGHSLKDEKGRKLHGMKIVSGSKLEDICNSNYWDINSFHCQVVHKVPHNFIVSGWSEDGYIEVIETKDRNFFIGVQFHPETMIGENNKSKDLFNSFIKEAASYQDKRCFK